MKLVYYHPIAIKDKHPFQKVVNPLISVMSRTSTAWPDSQYLNLFPMPVLSITAPDFDEISHSRIKALCNTDENITVLWSGGIDSTYVMTLMIETGILQKLHSEGRLTIGLNHESIRENPKFYENFIRKDYMSSVVQADSVLRNPQNSGIIITGEMADNLVGSLTMKSCVDYYNDFSIVHKPYGISIDWFCNKLTSDSERKTLKNFIEQTISEAPVKIVTNHELMWYLNFNFKWQAVNFRIVSHCDNQTIGNLLIGKLKHFFNTDDFQQWSMHEGHYFDGTSWRDYKMVMKKQIFKVTNDNEYYMNKTKYPSLPGLLRYRDTFDFIHYDASNDFYHFSKN